MTDTGTPRDPDTLVPPGSPDHRPTAREIAERRYKLTRATQIIWLVTGILEALFGIRVLLKLVSANPDAGFAQFMYAMTAVFLAPFEGLTYNPSAYGSVLEISTLVGMLVMRCLPGA